MLTAPGFLQIYKGCFCDETPGDFLFVDTVTNENRYQVIRGHVMT